MWSLEVKASAGSGCSVIFIEPSLTKILYVLNWDVTKTLQSVTETSLFESSQIERYCNLVSNLN